MKDEDKPLIIIDASVGLKWILIETEMIEAALKLRSDFMKEIIQIAVPQLFFFEVANTIYRKRIEKAAFFLEQLMESQIKRFPLTHEVAMQAFHLMGTNPHISFYDATYHALAIQLKGIFLTADERYYGLMKKQKHMMLLGDYR